MINLRVKKKLHHKWKSVETTEKTCGFRVLEKCTDCGIYREREMVYLNAKGQPLKDWRSNKSLRYCTVPPVNPRKLKIKPKYKPKPDLSNEPLEPRNPTEPT